MASTRNSPSLYVRFADPTTGAPRLWNQRTQTAETEERTEYLLGRWAEQRGRAEESRQNVEVNDEDSDDWENYDDDDVDEEVTTRSNCEDLPPEYPPPDYPPPDFHTLIPESSDQQGNEETHRKQIEDSVDIDNERNAPENDEEYRELTDKRWKLSIILLLCLITGGLIIIFIISIISIQLNYKDSILELKLNRIGQKLNRIERVILTSDSDK